MENPKQNYPMLQVLAANGNAVKSAPHRISNLISIQNQSRLIGVQEVMQLLGGISEAMAYRVISQLNEELEKMGYLTLRGKVDRLYLHRRFFPEVNSATG